MTKVVINVCHGGFGLSDEAIEYFGELKNLNLVKQKGKYFSLTGYEWYIGGEVVDENFFTDRNIDRDDPDLVRVVEELGEVANGRYAKLKIVDIPDEVKWDIHEYDGLEWIAEQHRTWS